MNRYFNQKKTPVSKDGASPSPAVSALKKVVAYFEPPDGKKENCPSPMVPMTINGKDACATTCFDTDSKTGRSPTDTACTGIPNVHWNAANWNLSTDNEYVSQSVFRVFENTGNQCDSTWETDVSDDCCFPGTPQKHKKDCKGYFGKDTDWKTPIAVDYCPKNCSGNGRCASGAGNCYCNTGWMGLDCSQVDYCHPAPTGVSPCGANATCAPGTGKAVCTCNSGYTGDGKTCTLDDPCTKPTGRCGVNSVCTPSADHKTYVCSCQIGYAGNPPKPPCKSMCDPSPCGLNTDCDSSSGSVVCRCTAGYHGRDPAGEGCTLGAPTACDATPNPCPYDHTDCNIDQNKKAVCVCSYGYIGKAGTKGGCTKGTGCDAATTCSGHGTCKADGKCVCTKGTGWTSGSTPNCSKCAKGWDLGTDQKCNSCATGWGPEGVCTTAPPNSTYGCFQGKCQSEKGSQTKKQCEAQACPSGDQKYKCDGTSYTCQPDEQGTDWSICNPDCWDRSAIWCSPDKKCERAQNKADYSDKKSNWKQVRDCSECVISPAKGEGGGGPLLALGIVAGIIVLVIAGLASYYFFVAKKKPRAGTAGRRTSFLSK